MCGMRKRLLNSRPDVGPQAVAAGEAQAVRALVRVRRRVDEIAAELADILEQVQSQRTTSSQNSRAENFSRITTEPPLTSSAPVATTPPAVWYSGRQSYMRSVARVSMTPAKASTPASRGNG